MAKTAQVLGIIAVVLAFTFVGHANAAKKEALININTADIELLSTLPAIGPVRAKAIISHRETHGPFKVIDAIVDVSGIGPKTFAKLKPLITVGKPAPESPPERKNK